MRACLRPDNVRQERVLPRAVLVNTTGTRKRPMRRDGRLGPPSSAGLPAHKSKAGQVVGSTLGCGVELWPAQHLNLAGLLQARYRALDTALQFRHRESALRPWLALRTLGSWVFWARFEKPQHQPAGDSAQCWWPACSWVCVREDHWGVLEWGIDSPQSTPETCSTETLRPRLALR